MKCPIDDTVLNISERSGIEIDYCPTCRGVWLDRGELDKIVERALEVSAPAVVERPREDYDRRPHGDDGRRSHDSSRGDRGHGERGGQPRRQESWISNLFG